MTLEIDDLIEIIRPVNLPEPKEPDVLGALENLVIAIDMGWDLEGVVEVAVAAIKKAKGVS